MNYSEARFGTSGQLCCYWAYVGVTVWVIRWRPDVAPNAEVVLRNGRVYRSICEAVERGGPVGGRSERYLEIHTRLRQ